MTEYVFVYGTLRPATGHPRARLLEGDELAGPGRIQGKLYDVGPYPAAVPSDTVSETVRGDVFRLLAPDIRLKELDREEGCPAETAPAEGLFRRDEVTVRMEDGRSIQAWVYSWVGPLDGLSPVPSGDYVLHLKAKSQP